MKDRTYTGHFRNLKTLEEIMDNKSIEPVFKFITKEKFMKYNEGNIIPHYYVDGCKAFILGEVNKWVRTNIMGKHDGVNFKYDFKVYSSHKKKPKNIPSEIKGLSRDLFELPYDVPPCVYFLIDINDDIVYVGQSRNLFQRINYHRGDKCFSRVLYVPCEEELLVKVENEYIRKLKPYYNFKPKRGLIL